ncbi:DNA/RNA non-specific endonuclease [Xanthovirga aplysinae]|uniref:DNA/RNA non-specific endonuclease n=1 Tax=Xanthovirga aplysinae TaxID=2529853 RepID=UPI0012BD4AC1|nr:DNA/RNA non-specific endonuclease [Xanthovirga aplysinae]MTI30101.1 hypothetical protein [Xanthovirga aplysinae]
MKKILFIFFISSILLSCNSRSLKDIGELSSYVKKSIGSKSINGSLPSTKVASRLLISKQLDSWAKNNGFKLISNKKSISILNLQGEKLGKIVEAGRYKVVSTFPLMAKKVINPLLDSNLLSRTTYKLGQSVFKTDKFARVYQAEIKSLPKSFINRNQIIGANENAKAMAKDGIKELDHGGHIIAHMLGGNSGAINIVAQYGKLNKGKYHAIERFLGKNRANIKNYSINLTYKGKSQRPATFKQVFEFRGPLDKLKKLSKRHPNFKYHRKVDANGNRFFKCVIFHSNKIPDFVPI